MTYKILSDRDKQRLLALLLRYAEHIRSPTLERAARALIDSLL